MREKHGMTKTNLYEVWKKMRYRCQFPGDKAYKYYGGRGITVCKRWESFKNFFADMGYPPAGKTIERIDNDGPYSPKNCKWSTRAEQSRNCRSNKVLTFRGKTMCVADWAEEIGIKSNTLHRRLYYGWSVSRALRTPSQ